MATSPVFNPQIMPQRPPIGFPPQPQFQAGGGTGIKPPVGQTPPFIPAGEPNHYLPPPITGGIKPPVGQTPPIIPAGGPNYYQPPPQVGQVNPNLPPIKEGPQIHPQNPNYPPPPSTGGFPQQPQQQYGLAGGENAFQEGALLGANAIDAGTNFGLNTLQQGYNQASNSFGQGINALGGVGNASAVNVDPNTGQQLFQQGAQGINRFSGAGAQAQQRQGALSGKHLRTSNLALNRLF